VGREASGKLFKYVRRGSYLSLASFLLFLSLGAHYIIRRVKMHYKLKTEFMPGIFLTYSLNVFTHTNTVRGAFYMHARGARREHDFMARPVGKEVINITKKSRIHFILALFSSDYHVPKP
jgi:hypothetical protein